MGETTDEPRLIEIVLRELDRPVGGDGLPVDSLGIASTDSLGRVGFVGTLATEAGPEIFIWKDGAIIWRGSEAGDDAPANASPMVGIGDAGEFVLRSAIKGKDTIWSHNGRLLTADEAAPGIPDATILLSSWTTMTPDGTAYWISEFRDGPGQRGKGRVLYRSPGASSDSIEVVLRSDDMVEGYPISRPFGLDFGYQVSNNKEHLIQVLRLDTGSTDDDEAVFIDGRLALREGRATSGGGDWERFMQVAINDNGDYLVSGELDVVNTRDTVIAFNGEVVLQEGQALGRKAIMPQAAVLALNIDNEGRAAHLWSVGGFGAQYLFFACDANRLDQSRLLVASNQQLQLAGSDEKVVIEGFNSVGHGPVLDLGPGDRLYTEVDLFYKERPDEPIGEAILSLPLPSCVSEDAAEPGVDVSGLAH